MYIGTITDTDVTVSTYCLYFEGQELGFVSIRVIIANMRLRANKRSDRRFQGF